MKTFVHSLTWKETASFYSETVVICFLTINLTCWHVGTSQVYICKIWRGEVQNWASNDRAMFLLHVCTSMVQTCKTRVKCASACRQVGRPAYRHFRGLELVKQGQRDVFFVYYTVAISACWHFIGLELLQDMDRRICMHLYNLPWPIPDL